MQFPSERRWPHGRTAFTLVELIVVVGIVAVLAGVLIPALSAARQGARAAADVANVRALQQASVLYAADSQGYLPDVGLPHGGLGVPEQSWLVTLKPYCEDRFVLHSPLDDSPHWSLSEGGQGLPVPQSSGAVRQTSYGINNFLSRNYSPAAALNPGAVTDRLSRIPSPPATVMFLLMAEEGPYAGSDHPHVEEWFDPFGGAAAGSNFAPSVASGQVQIDAVKGPPATFDSKSNWGFVDGHVATANFGDVYLDAERNKFDPAVAGLFRARTGG